MSTDTLVLPETQNPADTEKEKLYHVIMLNDDDHSFDYVIGMLQKLFGYPPEKGYQMAWEVHTRGRVIVCTTSLERAELKRDQIHAFGPDPFIPRCQGSMSAEIEPAEG